MSDPSQIPIPIEIFQRIGSISANSIYSYLDQAGEKHEGRCVSEGDDIFDSTSFRISNNDGCKSEREDEREKDVGGEERNEEGKGEEKEEREEKEGRGDGDGGVGRDVGVYLMPFVANMIECLTLSMLMENVDQ